MSEFQTLYRINLALHKQGKHACTECLEVYPRTHEYFHWVNQSQGTLYGMCKPCKRRIAPEMPSYTAEARRRHRLAKALGAKAS